MTYKMPNIQMKINENEKYSAMSGTLLIPTEMNGKIYKVFALVTNLDWTVEEIVK